MDNVKLQASDPVFGAVELLNEVSATKITGEEERYSHTDLYDIAANVEGAEVAFEFVKPVVKRQNPELVTEIEARFDGRGAGAGTLPSGRRLGQLREGRRGAAARAQPEDRRPRRAPLQGRPGTERRVVETSVKRATKRFSSRPEDQPPQRPDAARGPSGRGWRWVRAAPCRPRSSRTRTRPSSSTGSTRPASQPPSRTDCTSPPST